MALTRVKTNQAATHRRLFRRRLPAITTCPATLSDVAAPIPLRVERRIKRSPRDKNSQILQRAQDSIATTFRRRRLPTALPSNSIALLAPTRSGNELYSLPIPTAHVLQAGTLTAHAQPKSPDSSRVRAAVRGYDAATSCQLVSAILRAAIHRLRAHVCDFSKGGDPTRHFAPTARHKPAASHTRPSHGQIAAHENPPKENFRTIEGRTLRTPARRLRTASGPLGTTSDPCAPQTGKNAKRGVRFSSKTFRQS